MEGIFAQRILTARIICSVLLVIAVAASLHDLRAAEKTEEARALVQTCLDREDRVLHGIRWEWTLQRGKCRTADDAQAGKFDREQPVDSYHCRWLSNKGTFLHESIAQQEVRTLEEDAKKRVVLTTFGTEIHLATPQSRIRVGTGEWGSIQQQARGFTDRWGPGSVSIHSQCFGLGRPVVLLNQIDDPKYEVRTEPGTTSAGEAAEILRVSNDEGYEAVYYFRRGGGMILQKDKFYDDVLRSQAVVQESKIVGQDDSRIEIPTVCVSYHKYAGANSWSTALLTTSQVKAEQVSPVEMTVRMKNTDVLLHPFRRRMPVTFEAELSGENLDDVVAGLYEAYELRQAALPQR